MALGDTTTTSTTYTTTTAAGYTTFPTLPNTSALDDTDNGTGSPVLDSTTRTEYRNLASETGTGFWNVTWPASGLAPPSLTTTKANLFLSSGGSSHDDGKNHTTASINAFNTNESLAAFSGGSTGAGDALVNDSVLFNSRVYFNEIMFNNNNNHNNTSLLMNNTTTTMVAAATAAAATTTTTFNSTFLNITNNNNDSFFYTCRNESGLPHEEDFYEFYETAQFVTGLILYPCICVPGLMGNFLTLLVLSKRNMRTSTNAFLSALAVADSIKLVNDLLYFCTILLLRTDDTVGNRAYGYLYPYAHFIFSLSVCVSSWLTVSVAVERYIMVCHPTRARAVCSRARAITVSSAVFVVMTTLALPSAFRYKTVQCIQPESGATMLQVELTELWRNEQFVLAYNWFQNLLRSIVPLLILVVLNTCIVGALRKTRANKKNNSRHRVTVMMIIVILAFLVCLTPDAIMSTVFGLGYTEASNLVKGIREFTDTLLAINAATNFVIYCLFNRMFLDSCKSLFCTTAASSVTKKWHKELDESQYKRLSAEGKNNQKVAAAAAVAAADNAAASAAAVAAAEAAAAADDNAAGTNGSNNNESPPSTNSNL